jgi:hypothetical protein
MRVEYTIPGFEPQVDSLPAAAGGLANPGADPATAGFPERLAQLTAAPVTTNWRKLLRLDASSPLDFGAAAPVPPQGASVADPADERQQWRDLITRQVSQYATSGITQDSSRNVGRMLALLAKYQELEDDLGSRMIAESTSEG